MHAGRGYQPQLMRLQNEPSQGLGCKQSCAQITGDSCAFQSRNVTFIVTLRIRNAPGLASPPTPRPNRTSALIPRAAVPAVCGGVGPGQGGLARGGEAGTQHAARGSPPSSRPRQDVASSVNSAANSVNRIRPEGAVPREYPSPSGTPGRRRKAPRQGRGAVATSPVKAPGPEGDWPAESGLVPPEPRGNSRPRRVQ